MKITNWVKAMMLVLGLSGLTLAAFLWRQHGFVREEALEVGPRSVILFGERAEPLFRQCSRSSPAQVSGFWSPTIGDIKRLELTLPPFLIDQQQLYSKPPKLQLINYYKQYAGYLSSGKRMIYINAVRQLEMGWLKHEAIGYCDGGDITFGAEYDLESGQFSEFHFNGSL